MAAGSVAAVVAQGDGIGERDVDPRRAGDRRGDLGDLQRVGQPGPLVVGGVDHDLGLAGQPAEGGGVHDPVPVPLEAGALLVRLLRPARWPAPSAGWRPDAASPAPAPPEARDPPPARARPCAAESACARTKSPTGWPAMVWAQACARGGDLRQPPEMPSSAPTRSRSRPEVSSSQPSGSATLLRGAPCRPRGDPSSVVGKGLVRIEPIQQFVELGERGDHGQGAPQLAADRESLEVPGHVLAEVGAPVRARPTGRPAARRAGAS